MLEKEIEQILPLVEKPARYTGGEWNSIKKNWEKTKVRFAFAFPDIYEIGMSHLGLQIIYGLINKEKDFLAERTFAPWTDMEAKMRQYSIPLYSLESFRPAADFDIIGFTLQFELNYTCILNMLDLAGIPLYSSDRTNKDPLIAAGGPCSFNPELLADFIDFFVIGESEEILPKILKKIKEQKESRGEIDRENFLLSLLDIPGIYVPSYYKFDYYQDGTVKNKKVIFPAPEYIRKNAVSEFNEVFFPTKPIVPNIEAVHDRMMIEVARGCTRACRFCQAGVIYRPLREKTSDLLIDQAQKQVLSTGHGEISLVSLNTADYSCISELTSILADKMADKGVSISLPSLRVDKFSVDLADKVRKIRKSTLTFAPEAGTQRLRDVINKGVTEENLITAVQAAFEAGWEQVKLYFMIGLPTETDADLEGIAELAEKVLEKGREIRGKRSRGKVKVTISVSSFVPKAHTPFQWVPQDSIDELKRKQSYLKSRLRKKGLVYNWHEAEQSYLEAIFSKGNRDLGKVLHRAWEKGCVFDGWSEKFKFEKWQEALEETCYNPAEYVNEPLDLNAVLPWEHIDAGVKKRYLMEEYKSAIKGISTGNCRYENCKNCGACTVLNADMKLEDGEKIEN